MSEFHEVKCPEQIGRVSGYGRFPSILIIEFPPPWVGEVSVTMLFRFPSVYLERIRLLLLLGVTFLYLKT